MTLLWGTRQTSAHKGPREQMRLLIGQQGCCSGEVWAGNKAWVRNGRNSSPLSVERRFGAAGPDSCAASTLGHGAFVLLVLSKAIDTRINEFSGGKNISDRRRNSIGSIASI